MQVIIYLGLIALGFTYSNAIGAGLGGSLEGGLNIGLGSSHSSFGAAYGGRRPSGIATGLKADIAIDADSGISASSVSYGNTDHRIIGSHEGGKAAGNSFSHSKVGSATADLDVGLGIGLNGGGAGYNNEGFQASDVELSSGNENKYSKGIHGSTGEHNAISLSEGSSSIVSTHGVGVSVGLGASGSHEKGQITGNSGESSLSTSIGASLDGSIRHGHKSGHRVHGSKHTLSDEGSSSEKARHRHRHYHGHKHGHQKGYRNGDSSANSESDSFNFGQKQNNFDSVSYLPGPRVPSSGSHTISHTSSYGGSSSWSAESSYSNSHKTDFKAHGSGQASSTLNIPNSKSGHGHSAVSSSVSQGSSLGLGASIGLGAGDGQNFYSKASSSAGSTNIYDMTDNGVSGTGTGIGLGGSFSNVGIMVSESSSKEIVHSSNKASKKNVASVGLGVDTSKIVHATESTGSSFGTSGYPSTTFNVNKHMSGYGAGNFHTQSSAETGVSAAAGSSHSLETSGLLDQIGGLVGSLHNVAAVSAQKTGLLGGLLGVQASVGGYKNRVGSQASVEGYSTGHRGNYAGSSASSIGSSGGLSLGLGLGLGR